MSLKIEKQSCPPLRILQVVGAMDMGGVQVYLMNLLRHLNRTDYQVDFLVTHSREGVFVEEICALGSEVIYCPKRSIAFARNFKKILLQNGPYDIVHSHGHEFGGYILRLAKQCGVPVRIAQSHNNPPDIKGKFNFLRRLYYGRMIRWVAQYATDKIGVSRLAAEALFGPGWESDSRCHIIHSTVDLKPFHEKITPANIRSAIGIPKGALVIGNVGRFTEQKNHEFLVEIFSELAGREPMARLLLVGDGPLRESVERQVRRKGLSQQVIFAGSRPDVPRLMLGAMDIFLFPSLFEGLGLVLIEAQAAGLPCIVSDVVPEEADVVPGLVRRISLSQPATVWAEAVLAARDKAAAISQPQALALVEKSPFNILYNVRDLEKIYSTSFKSAKAKGLG